MMDSVIWWLLTVFCLAGLLLNLMEGLTAILKKIGKKQKEPEIAEYYDETELEYGVSEEEATYVCGHCGGVTHGPIYEYCGITPDRCL